MPHIRIATALDAPAMASIYNHFVEHTAITFDYELMTQEAMLQKLNSLLQHYPVLVAEEEGELLAYAYASLFRVKMAYQWSVETTIYLRPDAVGKGLGKKLYGVLLAVLRQQGFVNAYGCVTLPNEASHALHLSCGFHELGAFPHAGFKHGAWHSVGWYLNVLNTPNASAQAAPIWFHNYKNSAAFAEILAANEE